jgi:deazaflavin-dependent oxidoreductase (nitroreductase family)
VPTPPALAPPKSFRLKLSNVLTRLHVACYRATGGRVGGRMFGMAVLLLDHVGRKTGRKRTTPLLYLCHGNDLVVVASRGGSDFTPAWWINLKARPQATVTVGRRRRSVVARETTPDERAELWPRLVAAHHDYALYETRTTRPLPVILFQPDG